MFSQLVLLALAATSFAQISDNFESGWDQTKWPIYAPDCNQGGSVALDSTTAHSGTKSMKVSSPGGYCGHIFFGTKAVPTGDLYVRVWLKATNALTSSHVSFITMDDASQGANKHLRIGGQNQILMFNRESDDATLPNLSPDGTASSKPLPAGTWACFEYKVGTDGSIAAWLNSAAITGLTTPNTYSTQWQASSLKPSIKGVWFGWESYGGDANTFWYDDVAIASSRVGCDVSGTPSGTGSTPTTTATTSGSPVTTLITTAAPTTSIPVSTPAGCSAAKYAQCGGNGFTGCTNCASGATCSAVAAPYYSQCL